MTLEAAQELHSSLNLAECLDPTPSSPCESLDECARLYEDHTRALIIQSGPEADWVAAKLCDAIRGQVAFSADAGRLLSAAYANRSLWSLVHLDIHGAARQAIASIRLGRQHGFNLESGYAFWSLARTRFAFGFGSSSDVALLDWELGQTQRADRNLANLYSRLLRGAKAIASGDPVLCGAEFERAAELVPAEAHQGVVGRWGQTYWRRDLKNYEAALHLATGRYTDCVRLIEPLATVPFEASVARQYGQSVARHYLKAALSELGSRQRIEVQAPLIDPRTHREIGRHAARLRYAFQRQ